MSIQDVGTPSNAGSSAASPAPSNPPATPISPTSGNNTQLPPTAEAETNTPTANTTAPAPPKRKPSRRANTAERRATHNAVERQRRETLNGRFLDLAALLPNLASVRRPSKSAIVNSSIALVHQHRRQRLQAARELRGLKLETDALRRELNEWRDRAALPRVEEPSRTQDFLILISLGDSETEDGNWYADLNEMGEEERRAYELVLRGGDDDGEEPLMEEDEDFGGRPNVNVPVTQKGMAPGNAVNLQHILPRNVPTQQQQQAQPSRPPFSMRHSMQSVSPTAIGFDASAHMPSHPGLPSGVHTMYEPNGHPHGQSHSLPVHPNFAAAAAFSLGLSNGDNHLDKVNSAGWNNALFPSQNTQPQWAHQMPPGVNAPQHGLFTPPGTANSSMSDHPPSPLGLTGNPFANSHALLTGLQQQQQHHQQQQQQQQQRHSMGAGLGHGHVYASPELDDASSVSSAEGITRSGGGSPIHSSVDGGYGRNMGGPGAGMGGMGGVQRVSPQWGTPPAQVGAMMAAMM